MSAFESKPADGITVAHSPQTEKLGTFRFQGNSRVSYKTSLLR
jgi:hypothetical protein